MRNNTIARKELELALEHMRLAIAGIERVLPMIPDPKQLAEVLRNFTPVVPADPQDTLAPASRDKELDV